MCNMNRDHEEICKLVADGVPVEYAFGTFGYSPQEMEALIEDKPQLRIKLLRARSIYAQNLYAALAEASQGDWRATAWLVQSHPDIKSKDKDELVVKFRFKRDDE